LPEPAIILATKLHTNIQSQYHNIIGTAHVCAKGVESPQILLRDAADEEERHKAQAVHLDDTRRGAGWKFNR